VCFTDFLATAFLTVTLATAGLATAFLIVALVTIGSTTGFTALLVFNKYYYLLFPNNTLTILTITIFSYRNNSSIRLIA
jgi:hypothetical protein